MVGKLLLNGYETLDLLIELDEDDLDSLQITDQEDRAKIITAVKMLAFANGTRQLSSTYDPKAIETYTIMVQVTSDM